LAKLLGSLSKPKGEKKVKAPKSPKKEKKKEEAEAPVTEETPKEAPAVALEASEVVKEEVSEPVKETEVATPVVEAPVAEEVKEVKEEKAVVPKEEKKALKVGRRLSARVGDLFKSKPKTEVTTPPKVNENPPVLEEPTPVAPLENPASEAAPEVKVEESVEPIEPAVVTAAA